MSEHWEAWELQKAVEILAFLALSQCSWYHGALPGFSLSAHTAVFSMEKSFSIPPSQLLVWMCLSQDEQNVLFHLFSSLFLTVQILREFKYAICN